MIHPLALLIILLTSFFSSTSHAFFTKGTMVLFKGEPTSIETIRPGNYVLGQYGKYGKVWTYPVTKTFTGEIKQLVVLTVDNETIETTPEQLFLTQSGKWVEAGKLRVGDRLIRDKGRQVAVKQVEWKSGEQTVFTFEVGEAHTFFVGEARVLAHNPGDNVDTSLLSWRDVERLKIYELNVVTNIDARPGPMTLSDGSIRKTNRVIPGGSEYINRGGPRYNFFQPPHALTGFRVTKLTSLSDQLSAGDYLKVADPTTNCFGAVLCSGWFIIDKVPQAALDNMFDRVPRGSPLRNGDIIAFITQDNEADHLAFYDWGQYLSKDGAEKYASRTLKQLKAVYQNNNERIVHYRTKNRTGTVRPWSSTRRKTATVRPRSASE